MDGVEPDDERYPDAPVPPHERRWRHPSEVGEAAWRRTEPPLTLGRGLLVSTGVVGGLLALAVLWAMLPTASGGPSAVATEPVRTLRQAASSVRSSDPRTTAAATFAGTFAESTTSASAGARTTTTSPEPVPATVTTEVAEPTDTDTEVETTGTDEGTTTNSASSSLVGTERPSSSATLPAAPATITVGGQDSTSTAIAVTVNGVPVVLTTASAVRGAADTVELSFGDGHTASATVAMTVNGLAVLTTEDAANAATFKLAGTPHDGDQVTLLGPEPTTVTVKIDANGAMQMSSWGTGDVAEGTPVVNDKGKVVGLCSKTGSGPKLVAIDQRSLRSAVDSATAGSTAVANAAKPYLGVYLNRDPSGSLTINAVDPNGPAAAAGIVAGDTILGVDGEDLASSEDLYDVLGAHRPDDTVSVTVRHADGSQVSSDVVLAVSPTSA